MTTPNRYGVARIAGHSQPDPYRFLDRFERGHWRMVEARFHCAIRRIYASPFEVLAWLERDIDSLLPEIEELRDDCQNAAFETAYGAMLALRRNLEVYPEEAARYAGHLIELEIAVFTHAEMGAKSTRLREGGAAQ